MKIALLGDIAPFGRYCLDLNQAVLSHFESLRSLLADHDLVVGNLETPFTLNERPYGWKSAHIKSHPINIRLLRYLGLTHVTLANNHIADFGPAAMMRTTSLLDEAEIEWFGLGGRQARIDRDGERIALHGVCSLNTNPSQLRAGSENELNLLDVDDVAQQMDQNMSEGFFNILAVHSGQEHVHMPSEEDIRFARALSDRFDYVYYGHHPHVLQGVEARGNSAIFYSLGNLIFDDVHTPRDTKGPLISLSDANKTGAVATVEIVDGKLHDWRLTPTYLAEDRMLVGPEVDDFDQARHDTLLQDAGSAAYRSRRMEAITEFLSERKAKRDLQWYLRRLNINFAGMILAARRNARAYDRIFTSKLKNL